MNQIQPITDVKTKIFILQLQLTTRSVRGRHQCGGRHEDLHERQPGGGKRGEAEQGRHQDAAPVEDVQKWKQLHRPIRRQQQHWYLYKVELKL